MGAGNWGEKSELQTRVESRQRGEGLLSLGTRRERAGEGRGRWVTDPEGPEWSRKPSPPGEGRPVMASASGQPVAGFSVFRSLGDLAKIQTQMG